MIGHDATEDGGVVERLGILQHQLHQLGLAQRGRAMGLLPSLPFGLGSEVGTIGDPLEATQLGFPRVLMEAAFGSARRVLNWITWKNEPGKETGRGSSEFWPR
jgi:hypothetical protein